MINLQRQSEVEERGEKKIKLIVSFVLDEILDSLRRNNGLGFVPFQTRIRHNKFESMIEKHGRLSETFLIIAIASHSPSVVDIPCMPLVHKVQRSFWSFLRIWQTDCFR